MKKLVSFIFLFILLVNYINSIDWSLAFSDEPGKVLNELQKESYRIAQRFNGNQQEIFKVYIYIYQMGYKLDQLYPPNYTNRHIEPLKFHYTNPGANLNINWDRLLKMTVGNAIISLENASFSKGRRTNLHLINEPIPQEVDRFYYLFEQYKSIKMLN
jgi:hypothetical protein